MNLATHIPPASAPEPRVRSRPVPRLFVAAALAEIALDLLFVAKSIVTGNEVAIPGAVGRTVVMGTLAWLAIRRTWAPARWIFVGFLYVTAAGVLVFVLLDMLKRRSGPDAIGSAISVGYLMLAVAASLRNRA